MAVAKIDEARLPRICALDAGVLLLALRQRSHRPDAPTVMALWSALLEPERIGNGAKILIPAPAHAEIIRGDQTTEPPSVRGIEVAPFTSVGNLPVVAPCGTPLLASILSYAAYQGSLAYGAVLPFVYGIGLE